MTLIAFIRSCVPRFRRAALGLGMVACGEIEGAAREPFTVTAVGTSLTHDAGWSAPLADALKQCGLGAVRVIEIAEPGENSFWGVTHLTEIARTQPDVLLIEFSVNDARLWGGTSQSDSRANVMQIVRATRQIRPDTKVILMAMNPTFGLRSLIRPRLDNYYDDYGALAKAAGFHFVDHRVAWRSLKSSDLESAIPDGIHPNQSAAEAIIVPALITSITEGLCVKY